MTVSVIYIAGMGRSGSTLLARILGSYDGAMNIGEAAQFWTHEYMRALPCSCGENVDSCDFWGHWAESPPFAGDLSAEVSLQGRWRRTWSRDLPPIGHRLAEFYEAVSRRSDTRVVIDASKRAGLAHAVAAAENIDLTIIHLVRDPRGVAESRSRAKGYLREFSPAWVASRWDAVNLAVEGLRDHPRYRRVRFEDFAADPSTALAHLTLATPLEGQEAPLRDRSVLLPAVEHALAGNPDKLDRREVEIRPLSSPPFRLAVTAATAPLLVRYGYPLRLPD